MKAKYGTWIVAGAAIAMAGCSAMTGYDPTARTAPPGNDRFARAWCEAETPSGGLIACGSAKVPTVHYGERCACVSPDSDDVLTGRVVKRPNAEVMSAASRAYKDEAR